MSKNKFLILCEPRSGSNYLFSFLTKNGAVAAKAPKNTELFHSSTFGDGFFDGGFDEFKYLKACQRKVDEVFTSKQVTVAKAVTEQVSPNFFGFLKKNEFQIILLFRENFLEKVLSRAYAGQVNQWHYTKDNKEPQVVTLEHERVIRSIQFYKKSRRVLQHFASFYADVYCCNYDEITTRPGKRRLMKRLGLPMGAPKFADSAFKKVGSDYSKLIANYEDVVSIVRLDSQKAFDESVDKVFEPLRWQNDS